MYHKICEFVDAHPMREFIFQDSTGYMYVGYVKEIGQTAIHADDLKPWSLRIQADEAPKDKDVLIYKRIGEEKRSFAFNFKANSSQEKPIVYNYLWQILPIMLRVDGKREVIALIKKLSEELSIQYPSERTIYRMVNGSSRLLHDYTLCYLLMKNFVQTYFLDMQECYSVSEIINLLIENYIEQQNLSYVPLTPGKFLNPIFLKLDAIEEFD